MMRLIVELVPFGHEDEKRALHTIDIANVEKYDEDPQGERGYMAWAYEGEPQPEHDAIYENSADAYVVHRRSDGALKLAHRVLGKLVST